MITYVDEGAKVGAPEHCSECGGRLDLVHADYDIFGQHYYDMYYPHCDAREAWIGPAGLAECVRHYRPQHDEAAQAAYRAFDERCPECGSPYTIISVSHHERIDGRFRWDVWCRKCKRIDVWLESPALGRDRAYGWDWRRETWGEIELQAPQEPKQLKLF